MAIPSARADLVLELFDAYYERIYAFLRKSTTPDIADDLAQEVFVRLLQHPQLESLTISVSYLIKIAHNLMRRRYARAVRLRELLAERRVSDVAGETPRFVDAPLLETALGLLSSDEQNAVRLIVCEGKSYQHAAESLGVTVATVNNWKHRGLMKMRRMMAEAETEAKPVPAPVRRAEPDAEVSTRKSKRRWARNADWARADEVA